MHALRAGIPQDHRDFAVLVLLSAPSFLPGVFGERVFDLMEALFQRPGNLFSHENTTFAEVDVGNARLAAAEPATAGTSTLGRRAAAGMVLGYGYSRHLEQELRTGMILCARLGWGFPALLPGLLRTSSAVAHMSKGEYYVSNIAVYPQFRGEGLGSALLASAERRAKVTGNETIVLDVETDNHQAMRLYERRGYVRQGGARGVGIGGRMFGFYRMAKVLE